MNLQIVRYFISVLVPVFLIGCSDTEGQKVIETSGQAAWKATIDAADQEETSGEAERKTKVQALVNQLGDGQPESRKVAYAELRDTFVRKRDLPWLAEEIARNVNDDVTKSLREIMMFVEGERWRLPDKGWTTDAFECGNRYEKAFESLGSEVVAGKYTEGLPKTIVELDIFEQAPIGADKQSRIIRLILTFEPERLGLFGEGWTDITFLGTMPNLEYLTLVNTRVSDLTPLNGLSKLLSLQTRNSKKLTDLTPLKELPNLRVLVFDNTRVSDLTPLDGLPNLNTLVLRNTLVSDLGPLHGHTNLYSLDLRNSAVSDLTPLRGLHNLRLLDIGHTRVTDLTPLKELQSLYNLDLQNTSVSDLAPLRELGSLGFLDLRNTKVTDLTPLKDLPKVKIQVSRDN